MPKQLADPYQAIRLRLIEVYEPDVWAQASRILHMRELGDMQPTQLMDNMLSLLPNGGGAGVSRLGSLGRQHLESQGCQET